MLPQRIRKKLFFAVVASFALTSGSLPSVGAVRPSSPMAGLADPLSILAGRSPGSRVAGALFSTKPQRVASGDRENPPGANIPRVSPPTERVLSTVRDRPVPVPRPESGVVGPGIVPPVGSSAVVPPGGGVVVPATDNPVLPPGGGGFVPISGGGGGGGGGVIPVVPVTPTPPVSNVPEPDVWAMMILGGFALGVMLRRQRRMVRTSATC